jgi:hypothetical protein
LSGNRSFTGNFITDYNIASWFENTRQASDVHLGGLYGRGQHKLHSREVVP